MIAVSFASGSKVVEIESVGADARPPSRACLSHRVWLGRGAVRYEFFGVSCDQMPEWWLAVIAGDPGWDAWIGTAGWLGS